MAQRTVVTIGLETSEAVEILSGVSEGQTVLTSGVHGLGEKASSAQGRMNVARFASRNAAPSCSASSC